MFIPKSEPGTPNGLPRNANWRKLSGFAGEGNVEKNFSLCKKKCKRDQNNKITIPPNEVCKYCIE